MATFGAVGTCTYVVGMRLRPQPEVTAQRLADVVRQLHTEVTNARSQGGTNDEPTGRPWRTADQLELATLEWIDWFNHRRLHEALGYVLPAEQEANYHASSTPALTPEPTTPNLYQTRGGSDRGWKP